MFAFPAIALSTLWTWISVAVVVVLAAALLLLSVLSGALASMMGNGSAICPMAPPTPVSTHAQIQAWTGGEMISSLLLARPPRQRVTSGPQTTATPLPVCVAPSKIGAAVMAWAQAMANALYVKPDCHGHISFPNCYYTWYNQSFPPQVIAYGEKVCPGCSAWANGTYQCVSFVRGAYSQVYPMTMGANAFDLWAVYHTMPGWLEIPSGVAPPGQRGMPTPGDVLIFKDPGVGHAAIVMTVQPPHDGQDGAITFANANSVSPYTTMPLRPDLSVDTSSWPGYIAWGYLRPVAQ